MNLVPSHVKGLIFDCDGTVADTMPLHYRAWVAVLNEHNADFPEAMFYEMAGMPTRTIIELLNQRHGYNINYVEAAGRKEEVFLNSLHEVLPIEPIATVVREYAGKLPMAVATGGTRAICEKTLHFLGLKEHFDAIVTADDVKHGKPAPDIFLEAARRINVEPVHCLAFEDADLGLESARAAGMEVVDIRPLRKP
ncbi:MAG: beta-phosphoglucomutase family hydrolase [Candidatus Sumerlaeaceae bacterium]|nr:beta-phosphoglucomutase family hydrolase [Candidatus Sumerlaeaceae bacterium]